MPNLCIYKIEMKAICTQNQYDPYTAEWVRGQRTQLCTCVCMYVCHLSISHCVTVDGCLPSLSKTSLSRLLVDPLCSPSPPSSLTRFNILHCPRQLMVITEGFCCHGSPSICTGTVSLTTIYRTDRCKYYHLTSKPACHMAPR